MFLWRQKQLGLCTNIPICFFLNLVLFTYLLTYLLTTVFTRANFSFFSPRKGDTLHRSRWNFTVPPCKSSLWSAHGSQNFSVFRISNFTNIIAPTGHSLARFLQNWQDKCASLMYISLNIILPNLVCLPQYKTINNLPRWEHFPSFRWPLAAKLLFGSKNVRDA